jgi:hypothetical protein
MLKTHWLIAVFFLLISSLRAEICPSINEIQHNHLHGWRPYDIIGKKFIVDLEPFKMQFRDFAIARWIENTPEIAARCYYYESKNPTNLMPIIFVKSHTLPINDLTRWHFIDNTSMHCDTGIDECEFVPE